MKSRLAVRMPFIAPCSLQIHSSRSCPFGGPANISQDESACIKAHTRSPVSTRRSNHAAYSKSPRTDNGRKYVVSLCRREILQHTSRSHFAPLHSSSPTCKQDRYVGRNVCLLDPGVQLQIFHLLDFSFIASLDFVGGKSVDQGTPRSLCGSSDQRSASSLTSNFTLSSPGYEECFLPHVPS